MQKEVAAAQRNDQLPSMPLVAALLDYARCDRDSWHMPGHRSSKDWPDWLKESLAELDFTELPGTDDLNNPQGPARQAMLLAAEAFGAGLTRFITSGATTALQIMLALGLERGSRLLLPRCVHQAVIHAAALLDLELCWIQPEAGAKHRTGAGLLPKITAEDVELALQRHTGCRAVLLTYPDYYGDCADLQAIGKVVHQQGCLLLVDEAHGAHLAFGQGYLPVSALQAGADACVQSGHKTLPVLTPGAYLHIGREALSAMKIDPANLDRLIPVFQTSSPSFPVAATLDYARAWLQAEGSIWIQRQIANLELFASRLPAPVYCSSALASFRDPLRLVLTGPPDSPAGFPARQIAAQLGREGIDIEFADLTRLVLIPSLRQPAAAWQHLADVLQRADYSGGTAGALELDREWQFWLARPPQTAIKTGDALFGSHSRQLIPLAEAAGRICARSVLPYPPGIPLLVPGERIDRDRVDFLRRLMENEISISGVTQENILVLA